LFTPVNFPAEQKLRNKTDKSVDKSASMLTQQLIIPDGTERNLSDSAFSKKERSGAFGLLPDG